MVVMSKLKRRQEYRSFEANDITALNSWKKEQLKNNRVPTTIFQDPTDKKILIVCTQNKN